MGGRWAQEEQKSMEVEVFLAVGGSDWQRQNHGTWKHLRDFGYTCDEVRGSGDENIGSRSISGSLRSCLLRGVVKWGQAGTKSLEGEAILEI